MFVNCQVDLLSLLYTFVLLGVPQTPDLNFNDVYTSGKMQGSMVNYDVYENGFNWTDNTATQMLPQPTQVPPAMNQPMRSQATRMLPQEMTSIHSNINNLCKL